jgi:hypothetical protein
MSEPIFIAANEREISAVEKLLAEHGIDYDVRPEVSHDAGGVCFQGLLFEVSADQAPRARALVQQLLRP